MYRHIIFECEKHLGRRKYLMKSEHRDGEELLRCACGVGVGGASLQKILSGESDTCSLF